MKPLYNYGISQEDALTEYQALDIQKDDRLLCIASAGEIPLNLIALQALAIEAVDISQNQLFLAKLKLGACRALDPPEAASFLGFTEAPPEIRRRLFDRVASFIGEDERSFWRENMSAIGGGPVRVGRFEKYLGKFRNIGLLILGERKLRRLFEQETVREQQEFFDRFLSTAFLKAVFRVAFHPRVYRKRGIAVEGLKHSGQRNISDFFFSRFRDFCCATPARRNYYLQFSFWNRVLFPEALPEYLTGEGLARIRNHHENITWRLGSIQESLGKKPPGAFNKFHLSNIGDWMTREEYAGLLTLIAEKAAPSSKAVARYIHLDYPIPEALSGRLAREEGRAEELIKRDRFPFYNLVIMETR